MRRFAVIGLGLWASVCSVGGCSSTTTSGFTNGCAKDADCNAGQTCVASFCNASSGSGGGAPLGFGGASTASSGGTAGPGGTTGLGTGGSLLGGGGTQVIAGGSPGAGGKGDASCSPGCDSDASTGGRGDASAGTGGGGATGTDGGGAIGTGGATNPDTDAAVPDSGSNGSAVVGCGTRSCTVGEACCFTPAGGFPATTPSRYTCATRGCTAAATTVQCDSVGDCPGQKCCRVAGQGATARLRYSCEDQCTSAEIGCAGPENCGANRMCCESSEGTGATGHATKTACAPTCAGTGEFVLCRTNADCPNDLPACVDSMYLPGMKRCQ